MSDELVSTTTAEHEEDEAAVISDPAEAQPDQPSEDRQIKRDRIRRNLGVALLLAVIASSLTLLSVANGSRLSWFDESTHIDYSWRAAHFDLAYTGQRFDEYTLSSWSCRGQDGVVLPPCGQDNRPGLYPNYGVQYNAFHPPLYYVVTGISARAVSAITGLDFVAAARVFGAVWLWAGMFALYGALRYWRVSRGYAFAAAATLPLVPMVLHASSTVTNDAPAALFGAAAVFVLGRIVVHRNYGWLMPMTLAGLAAATKVMNSMALVTVAMIVVIMAGAKVKREGWKAAVPLLGIAAGIVSVVAVIHLGWTTFQDSRAVEDFVSPVSGINTSPIKGLLFDEWVSTLFGGTSLVAGFYLDPAVSSLFIGAWATLLNVILMAGPLVALAIYPRGSNRWIAGGTAALGVVVFPTVVQAMAALNSSSYFRVVSNRYGMTVVPLVIAATIMVAEHKRLDRLTTSILSVGGLIVLATTAGWLAVS